MADAEENTGVGYAGYDFEKKKVLGEDASCKVVTAIRKNDKLAVAVKIMDKSRKIHGDMFKKEHAILKELSHPNIINLIETFQAKNKFYIVTELSQGGELFDRIVDPKFSMTEKIVSSYMMQVLEALNHLHSRNIVHRDLKPENFIFKSAAVDAPIILIDFGTALVVDDNEEYTDLVGTPFYLAPESASNRPSRTGKMLKSSDIWSAGIITYICLTGSPPFYGNTNRDICHAIVRNKVTFPDHKPPLSAGFQDFVGKALQKRWKKRITMDEAMQHNWILGEAATENKINVDAVRSLRQFNYQSKLKKAVSGILASNMGEGPSERVLKHFKSLDKDGDDRLSVEELEALFQEVGYQNDTATAEAQRVMSEVDKDQDGHISLEEFGIVWQRKLLAVNEQYIKAVFGVLDNDNNGEITAAELGAVLEDLSEEDVATIIKEADTNGDGKIQYKEFRNAMKERIPKPQPLNVNRSDLANVEQGEG
jgi:calcium-dependent protein kinase